MHEKKDLTLAYFTVDHAPDMVFWTDNGGHIMRVNRTACRITGYPETELLKMHTWDLNTTYSAQEWPVIWERVKRTGSLTMETAMQIRSGSVVPVEAKINPIRFQNREYAVSFIRDITHRKKAEKKLQNALKEVQSLKDQLQAENIYLQDEIKLTHDFKTIVGENRQIKEILHQVEMVAGTDATVLILGETGTGKELIARAVHSAGPRHSRPLIKVDCTGLPADLIESELFGHEKGAFTGALQRRAGRFQLADGGTIFLDEIGDLPLALQGKLLRVLQDGEFDRLGSSAPSRVDVRVIAATNRNLEDAVTRGRFRQDLFFRLNVFPIRLPPLRDRKEDIPLLVNHFVSKFCRKTGKQISQIPLAAMGSLTAYHWPGNVREMENIIERAVILSSGANLTLDSFESAVGGPSGTDDVIESLEDNQRRHILKALKQCHWKVSGATGAAALLKINPQTLFSRMKRLGIKRP